MKTIFKLAFLFLFVITACKKKENPTIPAGTGTTAGNSIQSSVAILVVDESDNPVNGAQVTLGTATGTTDQNGLLLLKDIQMNADRAYVKVINPGYFLGSRAFKPQEGSIENVTIKLLQKTVAGSFMSSSGGTVTSTDGVSLVFPSNAISYETGGTYSGAVDVAIKHLSPIATDLFDIMPGNLAALDASGNLKYLETYGMAAIELTGAGGAKLNLTAGKTATLTISVPSQISGNAPGTIPLWYFDETEGIWKEEGSAVLGANGYVGEVAHFSFWNADVSVNITDISGKVTCNGIPLQNAKVELVDNTMLYNASASCITNANGVYSGIVPAGKVFTLNVYLYNSCDPTTSIYTTSIGPFSSPTVIPDIAACPATNSGVLSGTIIGCNGSPVSNGALYVTYGTTEQFFYPDASGNINAVFDYCSNTSLAIKAYDFSNGTTSAVQNINTGSNVNFSTLQTCLISGEYFRYTLDGNEYTILDNGTNNFGFSDNSSFSQIYAKKIGVDVEANISTQGVAVGTFPMQSVKMNNLPQGSVTNMTTTYTTYGTTSGSFVIGTMSGTFTDANGTVHSMTGDFKIKRP